MSSILTTVSAFDPLALPIGGIVKITKPSIMPGEPALVYAGIIVKVMSANLILTSCYPAKPKLPEVTSENISIGDVVSGVFVLELIDITA